MESDILTFLPIAPRYFWLLIAAFFLMLEAFGVIGVGMMFGGIAALIVGILIEFGVIDEVEMITQTAVWFGFTSLSAALLYKPMKRWRTTSSSGQHYDNIIGDSAKVVEDEIIRGTEGKVSWSGTVMNASIDPQCSVDSFAVGQTVKVCEVRGNLFLICASHDIILRPHKD
jgi:membrane protein implicated in regulation of membrane protease activity